MSVPDAGYFCGPAHTPAQLLAAREDGPDLTGPLVDFEILADPLAVPAPAPEGEANTGLGAP
jgi:hypothetical protein